MLHPLDVNVPSGDAWRLLRIISEFVDGFETLPTIDPSVSIFGSARVTSASPYYSIAYDLAKKLVSIGFSVITGAGPGIMEAANKAAQDAKGNSCGLVIDVPFELEPNKYIDPKLRLNFRYFFVRKMMFVRYARAIIFLPGGYGTLDELFEVITLLQTKKTLPIPVYFVGTAYWQGLLDWLKNTVLANGCISKHDLDIFSVTDDIDEVVRGIEQAYKDRVKLQNVLIAK